MPDEAVLPERNTNIKGQIIHEDWVAVILGFLIIGCALSGFILPVPSFSWQTLSDLQSKVFNSTNLLAIGLQFLFVLLFSAVGIRLTGKSIRNFFVVFPLVYLLTVLALIVAGSKAMKDWNLEAVIFSLCIGLLIGNTFRLPAWFRESLTTEMFVKIGLVLLGTGIIFTDILKAGGLGMIQALLVVLSVWYFAFWLCKKFNVDEDLRMMISSAVSICGVSAAIATAGAIHGDTKKLSYVISLVLITAIPMMIGMPYLANYLGLSQEVTGAWLGGSIDTTGAVVASGTLVGDTALKISTIVKFSQNVLLGVAAFAISVYWTYSSNKAKPGGTKSPGIKVIWDRFPKFVLGFIGASLIFSLLLSAEQVKTVSTSLKNIQSLWFVLAFTSIGLETNFRELLKATNRKPLYAFLIAQLFNVIVTLGIAYLLF